ncbi:MAG: hypothetical protein PV362_10045 [Providencia heimbachae]|nr:hypothetical protein [Providencia heimbachae]
MTPLLNLVLSKVHVDLMGMASGFTATLQQVGAAMGATAVSVILQYCLLYFSSTNIFEKLRTAISLSLTFNIVMSYCAALLLYFLVRRVPFNK